MKTQEQIIERFNARIPQDMFGFEVGEYVDFLNFENAKSLNLVKEGASQEEWNSKVFVEPTHENAVSKIKNYMEFAWDKANNCRGISSGRSIQHIIAWLWVADENELLKKVEEAYENDYHHYGKPILEMVCEHFKWKWQDWDNGIRTNTEY